MVAIPIPDLSLSLKNQKVHSMTNETPPVRTITPESERVERVKVQLQTRFGVAADDIRVVRAPLRICPLGAHIDHQLGVVTGMTIDQSLLLAFAPTADRSVQVESLNFTAPTRFTLDHIPPYTKGDWGNYIRGAALALQKDGALAHGIVGVVDSEMPVGGLSSSAAVTIAYLLALQTVNDMPRTPLENVALVTRTEHDYIGLNNGILDQTSILFSRPGSLTHIDCADRAITQVQQGDAPDCDLMIIYSGVTASSLVGTGYNNRVAECQEAARLLLAYDDQPAVGDPRLRLVAPQLFEQHGERLPEALYKRAAHYFSEMERVQEGVAVWQAGDMARFGQLMTASGASSVYQYECGSPPMITLYQTLADTPGVHGARFSGAGFRGNCIALIDPAARAEVAQAIHAVYPSAHPEEASRYSIHFCKPAGPAEVL